MNDDFSKVFDVSKPSHTAPGSTSRPIIVGHRPTMPDPMMRPPNAVPATKAAVEPAASQPQSAIVPPPKHPMTGPPPPKDQPVAINMHHETKIVSVSDNIRSEIAAAEPHLPSLPEAEVSAPNPEAQNNIVSTSPQTVDMPPASFISTSTVPGGNIVPPPPATVSAAPAPAPVAPEVHHQSLPMGQEPAAGARRVRHFALWLFIVLFLAAFAGYLAIDAGFINTSVKLPFHIFDRQA